ncbi:MAG TPA: sigma-70 family RNA polymerase sigma factor [Phycisphaerae bacterium]|nr:sigma-70 family RNA polymerase sigma factor [Phycisphaerae bacterium]
MAKAAVAVARSYEREGRRGAAADYDVGLMLGFQKGNELAFQELVERNHSRVIGLIYRFISDASDAEDLAQEVFLRIYRARKTYKPTAKFSTWMFRITANVSLNALRSRANRRDDVSIDQMSDFGDGPRAMPDPDSRRPDLHLHQSELQEKVREAIQALPEKQQVAVILNKYEGMSYADIARTIGCTTMAVKSLLARARDNLKDRLLLYIHTGRGRQRVS